MSHNLNLLKGRCYLRFGWLVIALCLFSLLNGCSTVSKDGPPPYDVDVSKIPNAQPKVEKLSKYGNMPVYRVNGRNYYVMRDSKHYEADGVASWYGTKFHKHNTSSGEKYDMLAMTAAHRTLPLPTYLEVTNKENGRRVIVKVNDRGPFANDRLLDLSYAAAKKLGMLGRGTANVRIKAIDPVEFNNRMIYTNNFYIVDNKNHSRGVGNSQQLAKNTVSLGGTAVRTADNTLKGSQAKSVGYYAKNNVKEHHDSSFMTASAGGYHKNPRAAGNASGRNKSTIYVQVGAFSNKSRAEKLKRQLLPVVASSVHITEQVNPRRLYRVQIGPIKDHTAVTQISKQLKSIGLNGKVMLV